MQASLKKLKDVLFVGNPMYEEVGGNKRDGRIEIIKHLTTVNKIDGEMVKKSEKEEASGVLLSNQRLL